MLQAGDAFLIPDSLPTAPQRHLWIVISDPARSPDGQVLLVNVTTWEKWKDDTCLLEPADCRTCPFIKHASCVDYARARIEGIAKIDRMVAAGLIKQQVNVGPELLARIRKGAQDSPRLPNRCQLFLADQDIIEL